MTGDRIAFAAELRDEGVLGQITVDPNLSLVIAVEDIVLGGVEGEPVIAGTVTFGASDVSQKRLALVDRSDDASPLRVRCLRFGPVIIAGRVRMEPRKFRSCHEENKVYMENLIIGAEVSVEVLDLLGRVVLSLGGQSIEAGSNRTMELDGSLLALGTYLYRVIAKVEDGVKVQTGRMVLIK